MNAGYTNPLYRSPVMRLRGGRLAGLVLLVLALAAVGGYWLLKAFGKPLTLAAVETTLPPTWLKKASYPTAETPPVVGTVPPMDKTAEIMRLLAAMQRQLEEQAAALDALRKRPAPVPAQPAPATKSTPAKPPSAPMLFVSHDLKEAPPGPKAHEYILAPGATKFPCVLETRIVSDVEGYFTCKVTTNIYDTATGRHLLVPQGSTVLGNDQANDLVYGSNRMDTVSLTLALPDGRSVDLGRAPVTDQQGVAGLTGDVNNHYLKLFGAVFIGGALRGGMTAMQTAMNTAAGAGQVASGIGSLGNQAVTTRTQPYINIKPTITVEAGQLCNVLLIKELVLPAMWQGGQPLEAKR